MSDAIYGIEKPGENAYEVISISVNKSALEKHNSSSKDFSLLCLELKQLYVAITRPKNRIIIFDTNAEPRRMIQEYW